MTRQIDVKALVSHIVKGDGMDRCRICLGDTTQGQVHLGDTVMMDGDKPVTLSELLHTITGVEIVDDVLCPPGVCVSCTSSALSAVKFRLFVKSSESHWYKAITNLANIECDDTDSNLLKSLCAFVSNDLSVELAADNSGGEPNIVVNRSKKRTVTKKKPTRKPRCPKSGPCTSCPDCNKCFSNPALLQAHFKNSEQKDACIICGAVTARGKGMVEHIEEVHKEKYVKCKRCPIIASSEDELKKHERAAHRPGICSCTQCGRSFTRQSSFETHVQMHLVRTCRKCGLQFTNRSCYREHRSQCEPEAKPDIKTIARSRRSNIRDPATFICDYCQKQYNSRPQLKNHILWIHMDVRPHQCQWCGKRFYTPARLTEHSIVHTRVRRFECDICGAKLVSKMAAVYHRRRHTGEKPFKCEDCGAAFISSSRRLEHAKRKHNKGLRIQCTSCPANFVRKSELKKHIQKAHSNNLNIDVIA